jgi:MFS family permease
MIGLAIIWMAFRLTDNPFLMGIVSSLGMLPHLIFSPFVGTIADTSNRRLIIFWGQLAIVVLLLGFALATFLFGINYVMVAIFAFTYGSLWAFMSPSIYGFTLDMVGTDCYINANSLIRTGFNGSRIIGPIIGGVLFEMTNGWSLCFLVAGLLMVPEVFMLATIKVECPSVKRSGSFWSNFIPGFRHIVAKKTPLLVLSIIALAALFGYAGNLLVAPICEKVLGNKDIKGIMSATIGIGAFVGAFSVSLFANLKNGLKLFRTTAIIFPLLGVMIGLSVWLKQPVMLGIFYMLFGAAMVSTNLMGSNLMPTLVDREYVGRSIGLYNVSLMGILPFGDFLTGLVSSVVPFSLTIAGFHGIILIPMVFLIGRLSKIIKKKEQSLFEAD